MNNMNKNIISLALLTVGFYVVGAADEPQQILSLKELTLQRVVQTMRSQEHAQQFARDPEQCEEYAESYGINRDGDIKNLIVDQLLRPYKNEICCSKQLHVKRINSVAWHPGGELLVSGSDDGIVRIWDRKTGRMVKRSDSGYGGINSVSWHPNETLVAVGSGNAIYIWDMHTSQEIKRLDGHQGTVMSVSWHPNGELLASGSWDQTVCIWDVSTGAILERLEGHENWVSSLSWHPEGHLLASGSWDGTTRIWDMATHGEGKRLDGHQPHLVASVSWHPSGELLASGSNDGTVRIWNIQTGLEIKSLKHRYWVYSTAWNSDGRLLASGSSDGVHVWNMHAGEEIDELRDPTCWIGSVVWHPHENILASVGGSNGAVRIWDLTYDWLVGSVSLMQALYFMHRMEHADIMSSVTDKGKEEEKQPMDDDADQDFLSRSIRSFFGFDHIEQSLHALKGIGAKPTYMNDLEISLPYVLKRVLKEKSNQE